MTYCPPTLLPHIYNSKPNKNLNLFRDFNLHPTASLLTTSPDLHNLVRNFRMITFEQACKAIFGLWVQVTLDSVVVMKRFNDGTFHPLWKAQTDFAPLLAKLIYCRLYELRPRKDHYGLNQRPSSLSINFTREIDYDYYLSKLDVEAILLLVDEETLEAYEACEDSSSRLPLLIDWLASNIASLPKVEVFEYGTDPDYIALSGGAVTGVKLTTDGILPLLVAKYKDGFEKDGIFYPFRRYANPKIGSTDFPIMPLEHECRRWFDDYWAPDGKAAMYDDIPSKVELAPEFDGVNVDPMALKHFTTWFGAGASQGPQLDTKNNGSEDYAVYFSKCGSKKISIKARNLVSAAVTPGLTPEQAILSISSVLVGYVADKINIQLLASGRLCSMDSKFKLDVGTGTLVLKHPDKQ
jgi:hypothetical protein